MTVVLLVADETRSDLAASFTADEVKYVIGKLTPAKTPAPDSLWGATYEASARELILVPSAL